MERKQFVNIDIKNRGQIDGFEYISSSLYEEKKSKFYAYIFEITDSDNANEILSNMREYFKDARHVVYAYVLENEYYGISKEEFENTVIPKLLDQSEGKNLKPGRVPSTYFFLWDNDKIVGIFKIRHCLNEVLAKGSGHVGYGILPKYRGMGYASKGLKLAIDICEDLILEDEVYMSVYKDNIASLKVQQKNGAYIAGETEDHYLTRIKLNRKKDYSNKR